MANLNYLEQVKQDVLRYLNDEIDLDYEIEIGTYNDRDEIEEDLNDKLWVNDSVTGNASGSYTFNREEAKEYVLADIDTVKNALYEFGVTAEEIGERFLNEDWEYLDVTARCYILGQAISEVLDAIEDMINKAIKAREEIEA